VKKQQREAQHFAHNLKTPLGHGKADEPQEQQNYQTCAWRYVYTKLLDTHVYDSVMVSGW